MFLALNANKRAVSANTKTDEGKEVARRLAASSDVMLANMRPGATDRMGLDSETLASLNPQLVQTHITAYGWDGPLRAASRSRSDFAGHNRTSARAGGPRTASGVPGGAGPVRLRGRGARRAWRSAWTAGQGEVRSRSEGGHQPARVRLDSKRRRVHAVRGTTSEDGTQLERSRTSARIPGSTGRRTAGSRSQRANSVRPSSKRRSRA